MTPKQSYDLAYRCADCGRIYYSAAPNLVERGTRCPQCNGALERRGDYDRRPPEHT